MHGVYKWVYGQGTLVSLTLGDFAEDFLGPSRRRKDFSIAMDSKGECSRHRTAYVFPPFPQGDYFAIGTFRCL